MINRYDRATLLITADNDHNFLYSATYSSSIRRYWPHGLTPSCPRSKHLSKLGGVVAETATTQGQGATPEERPTQGNTQIHSTQASQDFPSAGDRDTFILVGKSGSACP